ncbi:hypothetical protein E4T44_02416 [Aureobasidium sp. EXF-8845]|nr:hypothetical protein E4T44_02416 [Aureobasidium sp. EXF-8845]KAI4856164.1 hypothetical protein E4T45_02382 [Aureobasidium sp. EXF-8846]
MWSQSSMHLLSILALVLTVSSIPIEERATPRCIARDLAIVRRTVIDSVFFCRWWQEDTRTRTPFIEFTVLEVNNLCACIAPISTVKPTKHKRAPVDDFSLPGKRSTTTDACRKETSLQFTEPWHFCKFYNAYPRTSSPFRKYAAKDLLKLCNCVEGKLSSTPTKPSTSTKKTPTTTKKSSTNTTKSSTSTKKISTNTKKTSTKLSSSSIRMSSTNIRKGSTSTAKRLSTSAKPSTSTGKVSTSTKTTLTKSSSSSSRIASISTKNTSKSTTKSLPSSSSKFTTSILKSRSSSISKTSSFSTKRPSTSTSKQPSPASSSISATSHCKPLAPRYPGGYGYIDWNETNNMGINMCGYGAPTGNPPPQSYVLGVYQIYPYEGSCIQLCLETDTCQSWALDDSHTRCTLYNALSEEYLKPLQTSYDWPQTYYYDVSCYTCSDTIVALSCNTLSDSPPSGSLCGQLGLSYANARVASYGSRSDSQTLNNCALNCMSDLDCLSFSTDQNQDMCFYYNQTASTIANHYRGNTTEQTLYDVQCFKASDVSGRCGYQK